MKPQDARAAFEAIPTGRFTIHLAERNPIEVLHTDYAILSPSRRAMTVYDTDTKFHYIDAAAVTRFSWTESPDRNGE